MEIKVRLRQLLTLGVLIGCISSVGAAPPKLSEEEAAMVNTIHSHLARSFVLPKDSQIDPALRVAADEISARHLIRIRQLLPVWLQEERALQSSTSGKASSQRIFYAVWARLLNEQAFWQVEPGDADYENATLEVLKTSPFACRTGLGNPRFQDFVNRVMRLQQMPSAQRQAALAMERHLLDRWGMPRPTAAQPWPDPIPQDAGMSVVAQMKLGGRRPLLALPPLLAAPLLAKGLGYKDLPWGARCAFQQWWLRESLAQGKAPAAALNAFRYGTMIAAKDRFEGVFESENGEASKEGGQGIPAYPKFAAHFGVAGETQVTRRFDASGRPEHASVTRRDISVPGVRGVRPIAFENSFDDLAVPYALVNAVPAKSGDAPQKVIKMVWHFPEDELPGTTPQGEKR